MVENLWGFLIGEAESQPTDLITFLTAFTARQDLIRAPGAVL
jgi:hypothetical protein